MPDKKRTYKGKPIENLSKGELLEALNNAIDMIDGMNISRTKKENLARGVVGLEANA